MNSFDAAQGKSTPSRRDFIVLAASAAAAGLLPVAAYAGPAPTILVVGDSLSAEYGLTRGTGWVALLKEKLATEKIAAGVINASISGDTTSGGRARLQALIHHNKPTHVVIELGGNDALRGLPLQMTEDNLSQMVKSAQRSGAKVLLLGVQVPPNYGGDYTARFAAVFSKVAKAHKVPLVSFLQGVADGANAASLFQADRIHPNAAAQPLLLGNVWPELRKLLV